MARHALTPVLLRGPAAIASKLAPTVFTANTNYSNHTKPVGAGLPAKRPAHLTLMLADRPPLYIRQIQVGCQAAFASKLAPTEEQKQSSPHRAASHHSSGRALARLQLLILIHPPPRKAEWRRSSGGGRVAPFGEAEHIERRSSEADRRRCPRMNAGAKEPRA
ncbi:hypothetical protein D3C75_842230 [compost metagenome]